MEVCVPREDFEVRNEENGLQRGKQQSMKFFRFRFRLNGLSTISGVSGEASGGCLGVL